MSENKDWRMAFYDLDEADMYIRSAAKDVVDDPEWTERMGKILSEIQDALTYVNSRLNETHPRQ